MDRNTLDTAIEREVHRYVHMISEHVYDFTHLYCRRNGMQIDPDQMKALLAVVQTAIKDGEMSKADFFKEGISKALDEWTITENPTQLTISNGEPTKPGKKG